MALTDNVIIWTVIMAGNYLVIWRRGWIGRILGDLMFIFLGFTTYLFVEAPVTNWPWGIIVAVIAGIDLLLTVSKA